MAFAVTPARRPKYHCQSTRNSSETGRWSSTQPPGVRLVASFRSGRAAPDSYLPALEYTGTDTVERGVLELKRLAPLDVEDFHRFCASHSQFLIYGFPDVWDWLSHKS